MKGKRNWSFAKDILGNLNPRFFLSTFIKLIDQKRYFNMKNDISNDTIEPAPVI